jgi:PAS domain S-box-containing protein
MFVAWTSGTGPAIFATALTTLSFDYFFLPPLYSFTIEVQDIPRLVLFAVAASFVVAMSAAQTRAGASLQRARDERQENVRELQTLNETLRSENAERKRAEERARLAEQELRATIDTIPVLVLRHRADGIIDFVNQVGRSYSGLAGTNWTRRTSAITHPDDVRGIEEAWDVALKTGEPFETEARLRRADGEYRWFATRRVPLRNDNGEVIAWYAATYDIEDRKRTEDALRRSEADLAKARQDLQLTIDTISTMVVVLDQAGTPYFANRPALEYIGEDFLVENVRDLIHPDDRDRVDRLWRTHLVTGEPFQTEQRMRRADGQYRWNYMTRVPLRDETGKVIKWYGSGYDIEDRKRAEAALHQRRHSWRTYAANCS